MKYCMNVNANLDSHNSTKIKTSYLKNTFSIILLSQFDKFEKSRLFYSLRFDNTYFLYSYARKTDI